MLDNQTLQDKYPHLEVSVLKLSEVKKDNESFRIDSEYFKKEYLENEKRIKTNYVLLGNIIELLTDGKHGGVTLTDSGVLFLKNTNIEEGIIKIDEKLFISEEESSQTKRAEVKEGNILLSTVGTVGLSAVVPKGFPRATINQNLVKIVLKQGYSSYFISTFFNSYYGKYQIIRMSAGNIYQMINYPNLRKIKIPIFPMSFQLEIERLVKDSHKALESSKFLYKEAEALFYEALGLDSKNPLQSILNTHCESSLCHCEAEPKQSSHYEPPFCHCKALAEKSPVIASETKQSIDENLDCHTHASARNDNMDSMDCHENPSGFSRNDKIASPNYTIATLKESFLKTGRLDAEYYQSKYEKNEALLKSLPHKRLHELVDIYKSIEPGSDFYKEKGLPFVRVSNLSKFGVSKSEVYLDSKDFAKETLHSLYPKKDDVLLSKDGSVGIAYAVENDLECVLSGAILRLKIKDKAEIKPKYLSLVLNALTTQLQAQRDCGGSIIAHWRLEEIQKLLIPLLDSKTQEKIESKITQSFALRVRSKELLESAKQRVETAVYES